MEQVAQIWNHYVKYTEATFTTALKTAAGLSADLAHKTKEKEAFFIAELDDQIVGFATYGPFRNGPGYAFVKEHTIMVHPENAPKGLGRALMAALETHAAEHGIQSLFAGITGTNEAGIKFHEAMGFEHVTRINDIGFKFEKWFDLVLMRKRVN